MAFSATYIEITLRYLWLGQKCQTARAYSWDGAAIAAATPEQVGEAWWNHYKDAWRGLAVVSPTEASFESVLVREVGGGLAYGEYAVPALEKEGTRPGGTGGFSPSYVAAGCKLTVGTGVTRPGQMRIPFLLDTDTVNNVVQAGFIALADDLATLYSEPNILGAPVATGVLEPSVVRYGVDNNTVLAGQPIVGHVINSFVTSQVSRRVGHGD
jgi:hypothetical protein